ncbi:MAG TPA: hypothetical protein VEA92_01365 [Candidatus Paceibacterota bacterium]|nr:hypothetical protein [Candidatus Paceibacterota bacterium]
MPRKTEQDPGKSPLSDDPENMLKKTDVPLVQELLLASGRCGLNVGALDGKPFVDPDCTGVQVQVIDAKKKIGRVTFDIDLPD